jgi:phage tail sheath gpL-like
MVKKKKVSKKLDKHFQNKKKLAITIVAAVLVTVILVGSTFIYNEINTTNVKNQSIAKSDKPAADHLMAMAVAAENKNVTQARALFETAMRQYQFILDNSTDQAILDDASNGLQNCKAQIWMIDNGYIK